MYLARLRRNAAPRSTRFDEIGIPVAARRLLAVLPENNVAPGGTGAAAGVGRAKMRRMDRVACLFVAGIAGLGLSLWL